MSSKPQSLQSIEFIRKEEKDRITNRVLKQAENSREELPEHYPTSKDTFDEKQIPRMLESLEGVPTIATIRASQPNVDDYINPSVYAVALYPEDQEVQPVENETLTDNPVYGPVARRVPDLLEKKRKREAFFQQIRENLTQVEVDPLGKNLGKDQLELLRDPKAKELPEIRESTLHKLKRPVDHNNPFRLLWDILVMLFIIADLVMMPVEISFQILENAMPFEYLIFAVYVTDIFVNFHTVMYLQAIKVTHHRERAKEYAKSFLLIDLIAALPYFAFPCLRPDEEDKQCAITWGLFRLLRIIKVLRIFDFFQRSKLLRKLRVQLYSTPFNVPFKIFKILSVAIIIAHWFGSAWHWVAMVETLYGEPNTWIDSQGFAQGSPYNEYVVSLYWAATTLATIGYGDITPATLPELWFVVVAALFGVGVFAYVTSSVAAIVQEMAQEETKLK